MKVNCVKVLNYIVMVIFIILLFFVVFYFYNKPDAKVIAENTNINLVATEEVEKNEVPEIIIMENKKPSEIRTSMSLVMVGDYLIHNSVYKDAERNAGYNGYDFKPMLALVKDRISQFDLAYYNQETILGGAEIGVSTYPNFNSPYEAGDAMIDAGFNLVSLATNHTMDRGIQAVLNSRKYWDSHENVLTVGSYSSQEDKEKIRIQEKNGITYAMLNYTYGTNGMKVPEGQEFLINVWPTSTGDPQNDGKYQEYKEKVRQDVEAVRNNVDVLIVAMHWGEEYTHIPTAHQEDAANFLASLGVDIVIGTHPHVIQPVRWIDNTLVFYSLGNFISAQSKNGNYNKMVGLMSSLEITKTTKGNDKKIEISNINNELVYTYYSSTWNDFKVVPFSDSNIEKYLPDYRNVYENYKSIVKLYDDTMMVAEPY